jgi:crotonobetainyl-CoA:carnitine CoA-transferase CaiB-like acyl-CoA transferase
MDEVFTSAEGSALVQTVDDPLRGLLRLVASPIRIDGARAPVRWPPPRLDEHADAIRAEADGG